MAPEDSAGRHNLHRGLLGYLGDRVVVPVVVEELGLTQAELAEHAGMTQPQLSRLESGGATPTVPLLARLAAALKADLDIAFRTPRSPLEARRPPAEHGTVRISTLRQ